MDFLFKRLCVIALGGTVGVLLGTFGTLWILETFFPYESEVDTVRCEPVELELVDSVVYYEECSDGTNCNFYEVNK